MREWFASSFPTPTRPQIEGWPHIGNGAHTLICAPTGSGKTLTAFLAAIDRLVTTPVPDSRSQRTRVLYISPLRALAFDIEKNLRAPLAGIELAAERLGQSFVAPTVAMRTGDTPANERQKLIRRPPDLLITTPESLYLMLTSAARETLRGVETVIVDEIHAMATTKRGAHLALSLERLVDNCATAPQRIGLSATQRPLTETARFLGGFGDDGKARPVQIVDAGTTKTLELEIVVPVDDMSNPSDPDDPAAIASIWPSIYPKVLDLVLQHRSTIIFCNARRAAERIAAKLNELFLERNEESVNPGESSTGAADDLVKAHHGSLAREQRIVIEDQLKSGNLRAIVATSSLELGIDMGAVDLVIQIESPGAVSTGMQRVGRAGHRIGEPSKGTIFPKHRGDLIETAVVVRRMLDGQIEHSTYLRNPLDVLAQQIVATVAADDDHPLPLVQVASMVRRCANFHELSDELFTNVLDLLSGRYPSDEFSELRPRIVWDRVEATIRARRGSKRLAVTSGGTIPDRGLFGVFLPDGTRVGELDEEMVYETRPGDTFVLGASTWRIEDIDFARVTVTPAPGVPARMPFWHGDAPGRPAELGRAVGAFYRELRERGATSIDVLSETYRLDQRAANNVVSYLDEQLEATGVIPDDRTIVVERFRDEIGDWRVCILSPYGTPVHAPWATAIEHCFAQRYDMAIETMWTDDGIVLRLPEALDSIDLDVLLIDPDEVSDIVVAALPRTSLFAARFRECAGRALLLPRRRPDQRTPLWQQRQRAADLLAVAAKHPSFPILLETSRECLQDVFDVPALRELLAQLRSRRIRLVEVETQSASPMASNLLFRWIAAYMYEADAPLAERRAAALSLDRDLLRELLGAEDMRELLDADILDAVEMELQCSTESRRARSADELHDVLRRVGDLRRDEIATRCSTGADIDAWILELVEQRRAVEVGLGDDIRFIAAEDAARYRDAFGAAIPVGLPTAFTDPVPRPLESLVARFAATHGPFLTGDVARRWAASIERVEGALAALATDERVVLGEFRPQGLQREWCDNDVLRQLRRRSLAALRREVEPVDTATLSRFLPLWQGVSTPRRGVGAVVDAIGALVGAPLVASTIERDLLPLRVEGYRTGMLDELCAAGELVWVGAGAIGASDGRVRLCFADQVPLLHPAWAPPEPGTGELQDSIRSYLAAHGACLWGQLRAVDPTVSDTELLAALWDLVWAGEVTNDSLVPLRAYVSGAGGSRTARRRRGARPRPARVTRIGPPTGVGRWGLVSHLAEPRPTPTETGHATAMQMLERYGVVTREAVLAEGVVGGYASVYPVLKLLEERGEVRRGYFIAGLGAAQFALGGAVDRLRSLRHDERGYEDGYEAGGALHVMASTDPAQPFGAALAWPDTNGRPARTATSLVIVDDGVARVWFDRSSHHLVLLEGALEHPRWVEGLKTLVTSGREPKVEVRKVDGEAIPDAIRHLLIGAGFADGYRGLTLRGT